MGSGPAESRERQYQLNVRFHCVRGKKCSPRSTKCVLLSTRKQLLCMRLIEFDGIPLLRNGAQGRFDFGEWEGTSYRFP